MVVFSNFLAPQEGIRHEEENTTVYINDREVGKGTLYITDSVLSWVNNSTQQGFCLEYPSISLHAISRDERVHPRQCLYVMLDAKVHLPGVEEAEENEENSGDENHHENEKNADSKSVITEMRFAPDDINNLDAMFQAMSQCQALHPDPQDDYSDAEEDIFEDAKDGDYYESREVPYILPQDYMVGNQNGNDIEDPMDVEAGMFEDAEEGI